MNYNRVLRVADYERLGGLTRRKHWEIAMARRTLADFGAVHREAEILGVGAGTEPTLYHLSSQVRRVFATDLYVNSGAWKANAPVDMLRDPLTFAPVGGDFDLRRIVVQHMDMRELRYPDESFDGIFSSGSIEHIGGWQDIQMAAREIGRVLKPGGVLSLSTEFRVRGTGEGWPGVKLFDRAALFEHLIDPSGLTPVDVPEWEADDGDGWPLEQAVRGSFPLLETLLSYQGYTFTSVHIALRKSPRPNPPHDIGREKKINTKTQRHRGTKA